MGTSKRSSSARAQCGLIAVSATITLVLFAGVWTEACKQSVKRVVAPIPDASTIKPDPSFCQANAALCERRCAACSDKAQCFASGGECRLDTAGAETHIRDERDRGPDIWIPGCHFYYDTSGCTGNKKILWGDTCRDSVMIDEWYERVCHIDLGDHYLDDCNLKCQQLGLGKGKCITDTGFCGGGISSAHCECEDGSPLPSPTETPTVNP